MNNNKRRRLERRRRARAARISHRGYPLAVPPAAESLCAVCAVRPADTKGEIGVAGIAGSLVFPVCKPCLDAAPGVLERMGFLNYRRLIESNMNS